MLWLFCYGKCSKNLYIVQLNLNLEKENTKMSMREVTNFAKGGNFAKLVTSICFTGEERKSI